jgi:hypothetical protein
MFVLLKCILIFTRNVISELEAQWAEPVSLTFHSALRKLYTESSIGASTKFRFIWTSGFREEFKKSANQKKRVTCGGHVC